MIDPLLDERLDTVSSEYVAQCTRLLVLSQPVRDVVLRTTYAPELLKVPVTIRFPQALDVN